MHGWHCIIPATFGHKPILWRRYRLSVGNMGHKPMAIAAFVWASSFHVHKIWVRYSRILLNEGCRNLFWLVDRCYKLAVTAPSTSPENSYLHPKGFKGTITIASAMDMEIIWGPSFTNIMEARNFAERIKKHSAVNSSTKKKRKLLSPLKIGLS